MAIDTEPLEMLGAAGTGAAVGLLLGRIPYDELVAMGAVAAVTVEGFKALARKERFDLFLSRDMKILKAIFFGGLGAVVAAEARYQFPQTPTTHQWLRQQLSSYSF